MRYIMIVIFAWLILAIHSVNASPIDAEMACRAEIRKLVPKTVGFTYTHTDENVKVDFINYSDEHKHEIGGGIRQQYECSKE